MKKKCMDCSKKAVATLNEIPLCKKHYDEYFNQYKDSHFAEHLRLKGAEQFYDLDTALKIISKGMPKSKHVMIKRSELLDLSYELIECDNKIHNLLEMIGMCLDGGKRK